MINANQIYGQIDRKITKLLGLFLETYLPKIVSENWRSHLVYPTLRDYQIASVKKKKSLMDVELPILIAITLAQLRNLEAILPLSSFMGGWLHSLRTLRNVSYHEQTTYEISCEEAEHLQQIASLLEQELLKYVDRPKRTQKISSKFFTRRNTQIFAVSSVVIGSIVLGMYCYFGSSQQEVGSAWIHANETVHLKNQVSTVCGRVVELIESNHVWLNFEKPYPKNSFAIKVEREDFHLKTSLFRKAINQTVCTTGKIQVSNPNQTHVTLTEATSYDVFAPLIPNDYASHIGKIAKICGIVSNTHNGRSAVYMNLGAKYPNETISIVIWNNAVNQLKDQIGPLDSLQGQRVCALGKIKEYKKHLQMHPKNPYFVEITPK